MSDEFIGWLVAFLAIFIAIFAAVALSPWPACLYCEYNASGVYRVTADGLLGIQIDYGDYHLGGYDNPKTFIQYYDIVKYPSVRLPLNADMMICPRGIYAKVSYPTAAVDCGRDLPPPKSLLKVNVAISSGIYPKVCFDGNCIRLLPGHYVLWYDHYGGRIFVGELRASATCHAVQPRVANVDYSAGEWIIYPNEFRVTNTSYVCMYRCTVAYNVGNTSLELTTGPSMYRYGSSASFTAEECTLN